MVTGKNVCFPLLMDKFMLKGQCKCHPLKSTKAIYCYSAYKSCQFEEFELYKESIEDAKWLISIVHSIDINYNSSYKSCHLQLCIH